MAIHFYTKIQVLSTCLVLALLQTAAAQQTDFEAFPRQDANYTHLNLEMFVTGESTLTGTAAYELFLNRDNIESLELDAVRMDFENVEWNGRQADYRVEDDKLIVRLPEGSGTGQRHTLVIQYTADPAFGVFLQENGTMWSSGKPGSVRHWLPVFDHPRNQFTTDVSIIAPVGKQAVFAGQPSEPEVESVDDQRTRFRSDLELPASGLRFAVGNFERLDRSAGSHRLFLYAEEGLQSEEEKRSRLDEVQTAIERVESYTGLRYPSEILHIVLLDDDRWEYKNYGADIVFGFRNQGSLSAQLIYGTASQWTGVQWREEQWADADALLLMQAWLMNTLFPDQELHKYSEMKGFTDETAYRAFHRGNRTAWSYFLNENRERELVQILDSSYSELLNGLSAVFNWHDFNSLLYEKSGLYYSERFEPEWPETAGEGKSGEEEIPVYHVQYHFDEEERQLRLQFKAAGRPIDELVTVIVEEIAFDGVETREITFTGESDELSLSVSRGIENLNVTAAEDGVVDLKPEKPFSFWTYQLRNDEDPARRAEAAAGLADYADNPDLQLLLLDILDREEDPVVYAEMIRTLAVVTRGASGTDRHFRQRYDLDMNSDIQKAFIEAFSNYSGNNNVIASLRNTILNAESEEVKKLAARSLAEVTEPEQFRSISESLLSADGAETVAEILLQAMADLGEVQAAVTLADPFLDARFSYSTRNSILKLLLDVDDSVSGWNRRLDSFGDDNDPRIRYRILDGVKYLEPAGQESFLEDRHYEEYDARVMSRLGEIGRQDLPE